MRDSSLMTFEVANQFTWTMSGRTPRNLQTPLSTFQSQSGSVSQHALERSQDGNRNVRRFEGANITEDIFCRSDGVVQVVNAPMLTEARLPDDAVQPATKAYANATHETEHYAHDAHDMVCILSDIDNSLFRDLRRDRRNLVLDSLHPKIPHIIVTPPEVIWDVMEIPSQNRISPQSSDYLSVPVYPVQLLAHMPPPCCEWNDTLAAETCGTSYRPLPVFSRSRFLRLIERSSTERLILYHVITALQRQQLKTAASVASHFAQSFRRKYDSPEFVCKMEKPFRWTDPAEPLILASRYHLGATVIDSVCPFTAPHIIINEPPPQNPLIALNNATNDPQDCNHGQYLTVPSRWVLFVNERDGLAHADALDASAARADPRDYMDSPPNSPEPGTPLDDDEDDDGHERLFVSSCSDDENGLFKISVCELNLSEDILGDLPRPSCDIFAKRYNEDDEDDDLPPFDDWYLSVLARTSGVN